MANMLISMLLSMRSPILMNTRDVPDTDEIEKHAATCVRLFLNGVKGF
jgi:hypothetical protein